jgi:hypothetical protein
MLGRDASIIKPVPSSELASAADFVARYGFLPMNCQLSFRDPSNPCELLERYCDGEEAPFPEPVDDVNDRCTTEESSTMTYSKKKKQQQPTKPQNISGKQPKQLHFGRCALRQGFQRLDYFHFSLFRITFLYCLEQLGNCD